MRNILTFPITHEEMIDCIDKIYNEKLEELHKNLNCGDLTCEILLTIKEKLNRQKEIKE